MHTLSSEDLLLQERITNSRRIIKSLKSKADARRTVVEKIADHMTRTFGTMHFLALNMALFGVWLIVNTEILFELRAFDPFPFGLLTTIVSLEAIILAIFVLISQNRAAQVDDLREEIDLQVDIITEQELTKLMKMVALLMKKSGINITTDAELKEMLHAINVSKIEKTLEKQIEAD